MHPTLSKKRVWDLKSHEIHALHTHTHILQLKNTLEEEIDMGLWNVRVSNSCSRDFLFSFHLSRDFESGGGTGFYLRGRAASGGLVQRPPASWGQDLFHAMDTIPYRHTNRIQLARGFP